MCLINNVQVSNDANKSPMSRIKCVINILQTIKNKLIYSYNAQSLSSVVTVVSVR